MIRRPQALGRRCAVALAAIAAILAGPVGIAVPTASGQAAPPSPPNLCVELDVAPVLSADRNPNGTKIVQKPDGRGKYVPIVMVHGWTSRSTHGPSGTFSHRIDLTATNGQKVTSRSSLIGALQRIPGAAVYTFDYHADSAKWVDYDALGPALGRAIDCLYEKTGEKVIVIGHSMGGLVARYAASHPGPGTADRSGEISRIITFATPETGSDNANLIAGGIDFAAAAYPDSIAPSLRLMLAYCGAKASGRLESGSVCDVLPNFVKAFDSQAGRALQTGSTELDELPPVPSSITLNALAGDARISGREGWFGAPRIGEYHGGDLIVSVESAFDRSTTQAKASCRYQLDLGSWGAEEMLVKIGQKSESDVARSPLYAFSGACFHTNVMRTRELTNQVLADVSEDLAARKDDAGFTPPPDEPAQGADPSSATHPTCNEWLAMSEEDQGQEILTLQAAHDDDTNATLARYSVRAYCALNPGRRIDGVYSPGSRSPSDDGGEGGIPTCEEWRQMTDEESDAALLRAARGRDGSDLSVLRLSTGGFCKLRPDASIDGIYGGG